MNVKAEPLRSPDRAHAGRIAKLIADDFYGDRLDLASRGMPAVPPWRDMPEVESVDRLYRVRSARRGPLRGDTDRAARLFLTFIGAMDRARDATQLWNAGARLYEDHPENFDPQHVVGLEVDELRRVLKLARVSQRHGPDSNAWHQIATTLSSGIESPVSRVIDIGRGEAQELLRDLRSRDNNRRARFPMLRGPKIAPMWVRMMANPGRASIDRIETIPVAVDVHVRRATENLGVTTTRGSPLPKAKPVIQQAWKNAVSEAGIAGPAEIEGTCAALDPALWFFGRHGCGHCRKLGEQVSFGRACDFCVRFR